MNTKTLIALLPDLFHFVLEEFTDSFFFLDIAAEGLIQGSAGRAVRSFHVQLDDKTNYMN